MSESLALRQWECQNVWHCGIGNVRMPGIALPMGFLNARGVGIGNGRMSGIAALEMPECPA